MTDPDPRLPDNMPVTHNVMRSVDINLRLTVTNIPRYNDGDLTGVINAWVQGISSTLGSPADSSNELSYTLTIKHLADHLYRCQTPTPF